jgi:alpha-glucosidase
MHWLDAPPGVLAFERDPGFTCVVNMSTVDVPLPDHHSVLLASGPLPDNRLPPDTAAWLRTS